MNLYPYTDFHELNDDWIIGHIKKNEKDIAALQNTIVNLNFEFDRKADKATTYTKTEVNTLLSGKVDNATLANYYDKTETNNLLSAKADNSSLASVATSGNYNDLTNKPTIPAAQVNSDWDAVSGVAQILNKPTIPAPQVNSDWNANSGVAKILNKPTTLSGYGITDAYTKSEVNTSLANKADKADLGADNLAEQLSMTGGVSTPFGCNWNLYHFIIVQAIFYGNVLNSILIPTGWFSTTSSGNRILLNNPSNDMTHAIWQNGTDSIMVTASSTQANFGFRIYGFIKK